MIADTVDMLITDGKVVIFDWGDTDDEEYVVLPSGHFAKPEPDCEVTEEALDENFLSLTREQKEEVMALIRQNG